MTYKMIDAVTLSNFRRFMASGIPLREFSVGGAFDSARPRARDQEGEPESKGRSSLDVLLNLKRRMSPEGFKTLLMACLDDDEGEPAEDDALPLHANEPETAQDRKIAHDSYHSRFPHAQKSVVYAPELPKPVRTSATAAKGYADRFPDAPSVRGA